MTTNESIDEIPVSRPQHPKCPVTLLLDISASMEGDPIKELNEGIKLFKEEVLKDDLAPKRIEPSIISFGGTVEVAQEFAQFSEFNFNELTANGETPMGEAILLAIENINKRKAKYNKEGVQLYRPWIIMITDGEPTDMREGDATWEKVVEVVHEGQKNKEYLFFIIGVEGANMNLLEKIAWNERPPKKLDGLQFKELFTWVTVNLRNVSHSKPDDNIQFSSTDGWSQTDTAVN